jgi:hypothetical protein
MERRRADWLVVMALAMPLLGPAIAEWILSKSEARRPLLYYLFWGLFAVQLAIILCIGSVIVTQIQALNKTKDNLYAVQLAIARWQYDCQYESVPDGLDDLIAKRYLTKLPTNPYTDKAIRAVALDSELSPGDINYLAVYNTCSNDYELPCSFALVCYGPSWYNNRYSREPYLPPHVLIYLDPGGDLYGYTDTNGDGVLERARGKSGLSGPDIFKVYRGERIRGWVTAEEYRRIKAKQQVKGVTR